MAFRSSVLVLWGWMAFPVAVLYGIGAASGQSPGLTFLIDLSLLVGAVLAVAAILLPVYVRPDTMRCYTFFGIYRTLGWEQIASVRPSNLLGLRYLIVGDSSGREVWLPLYLSDMPRFVSVVRTAAGADHILVRAIEGRA